MENNNSISSKLYALLHETSNFEHDQRFFAMLNCGSAIGKSEFEGGNSLESINYFHDLLQLDYTIFDLGLNDEQLAAVKLAIDDLLFFKQLFAKFSLDNINFIEIRDSIEQRLSLGNRNFCYLPSGWCGSEVGHFAAIKIRKLSECYSYAFSIINKGAGIKNHRPLSVSEKKLKKDYQSNEYEINLDTELGLFFLEGIIRLNYDVRPFDTEELLVEKTVNYKNEEESIVITPNNKVINHYDDKDLYGLLVGCGVRLESQLYQIELRAVTLQRTGTCSVASVKAVACDALISNQNVNSKIIKRFSFAIKLMSLIEAYKMYGQKKFNFDLIQWALREFNVRIIKHYPEILSNQELEICHEISAIISQRLQTDNSAKIEALCKSAPLPPLRGLWNKTAIGFDLPALVEDNPNISQIVKIRKLDKQGCLPKEVKNYLVQATDYFDNLTDIADLMELRQFMYSLEKTTGEESDVYWDAVPSTDLNDIIANLVKLVTFRFCPEGEAEVYKFELVLIAYDIAAQLFPRIPELKSANEFCLALSDVFLEKSFYSDAFTYHTIKQISLNFMRRAQDKKLILSNRVEFSTEDPTRHYVMNILLSSDKRWQAINLLKDLKIISASVTKINDDQLFEMLLTKICRKVDEEKNIVFPTETILGNVFVDILSLSASVHALGHQVNSYSKESHYLYFANSRYIDNLTLEQQLKNTKAGSAIIQLAKHFPDISAKYQQALYLDFAENTIFHPQEDLLKLRETINELLRTKFRENSKEILPYQINAEGAAYPKNLEAKYLRSFNEQTNEDFRCIEVSLNLRVQRLLEWGCCNIESFVGNEIRERFFQFLFRFGLLEQAIRNSKEECCLLIEKFLKAGFEYYQHATLGVYQHWETSEAAAYVWFCEIQSVLQNYLEIFITLDQAQPINIKLFSTRYKLFEKLEEATSSIYKAHLAAQFILTYQSNNDFVLEDYAAILFAKLVYNMTELNLHKVKHSTESRLSNLWLNYAPVLITLLGSLEQNDLDNFVNKIMERTTKNTKKYQWNFNGRYLSTPELDLEIDLLKGYICKNNKRLTNYATWLSDHPVLRDIKFDRRKNTLLHVKNDIYRTIDHKFEFCLYDNFDFKEIYCNILIERKRIKLKLICAQGNSYVIKDFFEKNQLNNPLESEFRKYNYWLLETDNSKVFADSIKEPEKAYLYTPDVGWISLKYVDNQWVRDGYVLLNLLLPITELEKKWAAWLQKKLGINGVNITGKVDEQNHYQIERLEIENLSLVFICKNNALECVNYPGYRLSEKQSLPVLSGLNSLIILVNELGDEKYLLPAFSMVEVPGNAAFINKNFLGYNESKVYYCYEIDRSGYLHGDCIEADLYLAIIYRAQKDYQKAIYSLQRSFHYSNNSYRLEGFAEEIIKYKDQTPLGAAFDCKLGVRMFLHVDKWIVNKNKWYRITDFRKYILEQLSFYEKIISDRKIDVNILPIYLRLTDEEISLIKASQASNDDTKITQPTKEDYYQDLFNERLNKIIKVEVPEFYWNMEQKHKQQLEFLSFDSERHHLQVASDKISLRIFYDKKNEVLNRQKKNYGNHPSGTPGLDHLKKYFVNYFEDARSDDIEKIQLLKVKLYFLLQNDQQDIYKTTILISALLFVVKYPELFNHIKKPFESKTCFAEVSKIYLENILGKRFADDSARESYNAPSSRNTALKKVSNVLELFDIKGETVLLNQTISLPSGLPRASKAIFNLEKNILDESAFVYLERLLVDYFDVIDKKIAINDFALDELEMSDATFLEKKLLHRYRQGHEENKEKQKKIYKIKDNVTLKQLQQALTTEKIRCEEKIANDKICLLEKANSTLLLRTSPADSNDVASSLLIKTAWYGEQIMTINLHDLVFALLTHGVTDLQLSNPMLNQHKINNLIQLTCKYMLLQTYIDQLNEALELIDCKHSLADMSLYEHQLLGVILSKRRAYDISIFPEFLVYEYTTKRMLRADQVKVLAQLIDCIEKPLRKENSTHHALLQFAAGGGKTSVIIPILAQRFARKGYLPVIFNTNELYNIGIKDIPESLRASFHQNMEVLEIELEHKWTVEEFEKLLADLKNWREGKKVLLIKTIAWHSIFVAMKIAYAEHDEKLASSAQKVLDYFYEHAVKLEDEGHLISDPLQEVIKTYGKMQTIPAKQQDLFIRFYDCLMGYEADCEVIMEKAGVADKSKNLVNNDTLIYIQEALAQKIIKEPFFDTVQKDALKNYLLQSSQQRPLWLIQLNNREPDLADLIVLARAFIKTHLPHVLSLQYAKDYGVSIHQNDLTAAPKHDGKDVTSHFSDPALVMALTIQLYNQQALPSMGLQSILESFRKDHLAERKWNKSSTEAQQFFNHYFADTPINLDTLTIQGIQELLKNKVLRSHPVLIRLFLKQYALPQIKIPLFRVVSTPADLQAGFKYSLIFTATPGLQETYPIFLNSEYCLYEHAFEAEVIDTLLQPKNARHLLLPLTHTPEEFFKQLHNENSQLFTEMTALIDRGALLSNAKAKEVIQAYLAIIQREETTAAVCFEGQHMLLRSNNSAIKSADIPGSRLIEALKRQGLDPESFLLFLFLDLSKTTGTDIKRPYNDRAGLTVGKEQTVTEIIQAAMRERQLLWDNAQTVIWIMFKTLYQAIYPNQSFSLKQVFYWMIRNEARQIATKVIMRAYQGIYQQIEAVIWNSIRKGVVSYQRYKDRLQKVIELKPYKIYEIESCYDRANKVLTDYIDDLCQFFDITQSMIPGINQQRINEIVTQTASLIDNLRQPHGAELNSEVYQEQQSEVEQEQEIEQEQKLKSRIDSWFNFSFALEQYDESDKLENIFEPANRNNKRYIQLAFNGCQHIALPKLLICPQHFSPLKIDSYCEVINYLKPINLLLVKIENDSIDYLACTPAGAEFYCDEIRKVDGQEKVESYVIVGMDGNILFSSKNLTHERKQELVENAQLKQMINFIAFINGYIKNPKILSEVVKNYGWSKADYQKLTDAIRIVHLSQHPVKLNDIAKFEILCGWRYGAQSFKHKLDSEVSPVVLTERYERLNSLKNLPRRISTAHLIMQPESILFPCLLGKRASSVLNLKIESSQMCKVPADVVVSINEPVIDPNIASSSHEMMQDDVMLQQAVPAEIPSESSQSLAEQLDSEQDFKTKILQIIHYALQGIEDYKQRDRSTSNSHLSFFSRVFDSGRGYRRAMFYEKILKDENVDYQKKLVTLCALLFDEGKTLQVDVGNAISKKTNKSFELIKNEIIDLTKAVYVLVDGQEKYDKKEILNEIICDILELANKNIESDKINLEDFLKIFHNIEILAFQPK